MGWLIALAVIVAVLWIPLGVTAAYEESGAVVKLVLGFLRFQLYPGKPKEKKEEPKKEQKPAPGKPAAPKEEKKGGSNTLLIVCIICFAVVAVAGIAAYVILQLRDPLD